MEKRILEILLDVQKDIKTVGTDVSGLQIDMKTVSTDVSALQKDLQPIKANIEKIKETVNRIEDSQTEDVIGLLKLTKKKTDFESEYINNRLTEMDKRLFQLEKRIEN